VIEETGVKLSYSVGQKKAQAGQAVQGKGCFPITEEEKQKLIDLGIVKLRKTRTGKEIAQASISSLTDIEMSDREDAELRKLVEKTKEGGINLDEQS